MDSGLKPDGSGPAIPSSAVPGVSPSEAQRAADRERAVAAAKRESDAPEAGQRVGSLSDNIDRMILNANSIINGPALSKSVGLDGAFPSIPGGKAADMDVIIDSFKLQISGSVLQTMRDMSKNWRRSCKYRKDLLSPWPWLGAALCLLIVSPYLLWQVDNDWPTLKYWIGYGTLRLHHASVQEYALDIFYAMNSALLPVYAIGLWRIFRRFRETNYGFLGVMFLATLVLLFLLHAKTWMLAELFMPLIAAGAVGVEEMSAGRSWGKILKTVARRRDGCRRHSGRTVSACPSCRSNLYRPMSINSNFYITRPKSST